MIKSDFASIFSAEAIAAFQRQFHLGVETLDNAAGILFGGLEIIEQQGAVGLESSGNFFERIEAGASDLLTPGIEEFSGPSRRAVSPEVPEGFHEQKGAKGAQRGALNLAHAAALSPGPVGSSFQECPAHLLEQGFQAGLNTRTGFLAPDFVNGVIEFFDDVEGVEDLQGVGQVGGRRLEIGLPHVRADEANARAKLGAENLEEEIEGFLGAVPTDPQEALAVSVNLVDQRPELVFLAHMDLIDAKSYDPGEVSVFDAVFDNPLHRAKNIGPADAEGSGNLRPGKQSSPLGEEEPEHIADLILAGGPRQPFNGWPALAAVDAPGSIDQKDEQSPEGDEVPLAFGLPVISRPLRSASRTNPATAVALGNFHPHGFWNDRIPCHGLIDKALDRMKLSEYGFQRYVTHNRLVYRSPFGLRQPLFFSRLPQASLTQVPPERLPRRAVRGLGAHSPHQTGSFYPQIFLKSRFFHTVSAFPSQVSGLSWLDMLAALLVVLALLYSQKSEPSKKSALIGLQVSAILLLAGFSWSFIMPSHALDHSGLFFVQRHFVPWWAVFCGVGGFLICEAFRQIFSTQAVLWITRIVIIGLIALRGVLASSNPIIPANQIADHEFQQLEMFLQSIRPEIPALATVATNHYRRSFMRYWLQKEVVWTPALDKTTCGKMAEYFLFVPYQNPQSQELLAFLQEHYLLWKVSDNKRLPVYIFKQKQASY